MFHRRFQDYSWQMSISSMCVSYTQPHGLNKLILNLLEVIYTLNVQQKSKIIHEPRKKFPRFATVSCDEMWRVKHIIIYISRGRALAGGVPKGLSCLSSFENAYLYCSCVIIGKLFLMLKNIYDMLYWWYLNVADSLYIVILCVDSTRVIPTFLFYFYFNVELQT